MNFSLTVLGDMGDYRERPKVVEVMRVLSEAFSDGTVRYGGKVTEGE